MKSTIVINTTFNETRIALLENNKLGEFYIERSSKRQIVGNVYKGRVSKVVPGMQAAFIDIGLEKAGFISVEDVYEESILGDFIDHSESIKENNKKNLIQQILKERQEVIVQTIKEPINNKGPKLTSYIGIPGKYLVLLGTVDIVGISKKIENEDERERLIKLIKKSKPKNVGFIARTISEEANEQEIKSEIRKLARSWNKIKKTSENNPSPHLLYEEPKLYIRTIRDLISKDVDEIFVDSKKAYSEIRKYLNIKNSNDKIKLQLHDGEKPIFEKFNIENELDKLYQRKVWLKSGAYIIIEETEGLTVIDVNTGKHLSEGTQDETIVKINNEAAREAAHQIRLRNLVGIIVIDFIDLKSPNLTKKVYETFTKSLRNDKARTVFNESSSFGVIQLTRQRVRESVLKSLAEPCVTCRGTGYIKSKDTICYEILRKINELAMKPKVRKINVHTDLEIIENLKEIERKSIQSVRRKYRIRVDIKQDENIKNDFIIKTE